MKISSAWEYKNLLHKEALKYRETGDKFHSEASKKILEGTRLLALAGKTREEGVNKLVEGAEKTSQADEGRLENQNDRKTYDGLRKDGAIVWSEGQAILGKGDKDSYEGGELIKQGNALHFKGNRNWEICDLLLSLSRKIWEEIAVKEYPGNKFEYTNYNEKHQLSECHFDNGDVYKFED